jgi:RHS repeat-associated protein
LTVDLNGLIDRAQLQPYEHLSIFYRTDNPDAPWSELVDAREVERGVVQVPLAHFSVYAAGVNGDAPAGWKLKYNPPVASTFSGAATFNYPIEVPPGRNGLQPSVVLGYNSRSVDGVVNINTEDSDGVPFGWSLDMASIARNGMKLVSDGAHYHMYFPERFSLSINGSNTDIFPAIPGAHCGRYVAKDAPQLYIERRNDYVTCSTGTTTNSTHEYWIVKTGDGTTYRFGYNSDAEQVVTQNAGFAWAEGYAGALCVVGARCTGAVSRWRVDQVSDVHGNTMTFYYQTTSTTEQVEDHGQPITTEHTRPAEIKYNFNGSTPTSRVVFTNTNTAVNWINRIAVYHAGETNKIREYQLGWDGALLRMTAITQTNATGTQWLPPTTFQHQDLAHGNGTNAPMIPHLTQIANGYGGRTVVNYESDGRHESSSWTGLVFGYSFRVAETLTYDGINPAPAKVRYTYGKACYDEYSTLVPGTVFCRGAYPPEYGPLVGHQVVTQTVYADDGTTIAARTVYSYSIADNDSPFRGRELWSKRYDGDTVLTLNASQYVTMPVNNTVFTYLRQQDQTTYDGALSATTTISYTYDNYGNVVRQYELGDSAAGDERTQQTFFTYTLSAATPQSATFYTPSSATASSSLNAATGPDKAIDGNAGIGWVSATGSDLWRSEWLAIWLATAQPIDLVKFVEDPDRVSDRFELAYWTGAAWQTIAPSDYVSVNDGSGATAWRLITPISTRGIRITAGRMGGESPDYAWGVREASVGKTPGDNPGQWIVSKPTRTQTCDGIASSGCGTSAVQRTLNYYDGSLINDAAPTKGLLTAVAVGSHTQGYVTTTMAYDAWGNPTVVTDTRGYTTTTVYDTAYRLYPVRVTNALGQSTWTQYDYGLGVPTVITDANGVATRYTYDTFGRLLTVVGPGDTDADPAVKYHYSDVVGGSPFWIAPFRISESRKPQSGGPGMRHFYDGLGREIQTHTGVSVTVSGSAAPVDIVVSQRYDARGLVISQTVPYTVPAYVYNSAVNPYTTVNQAAAPKTLTQYDALGRAVGITNTDGTATRFFYAVDVVTGLPMHVVQDANNTAHKKYVQDAFGRLTSVHDVIGTYCPVGQICGGPVRTLYAETKYTYDVLGNLTKVRDALGNTTVMTYNALGLKTEMIDPDMGRWTYQYDPAGNLITQTDAIGNALWFKYDALNRLTEKRQTNSAGTLLAGYTYGSTAPNIGYRLRMDDPSGYATWTYDNRGRVLSDTKAIKIGNATNIFTTSFGYDALDRVITTTYHAIGEVVTQTYNSMGALENVRSVNLAGTPNQWYASNLDYNANGSLARLDLGNGLTTLHGYFGLSGNPWDARPAVAAGLGAYGRLWRTRLEAPSGAVLKDTRYAYDSVGNVTYIHDLPRAITGTGTITLTEPFTSSARWQVGPGVTLPYSEAGGNTVARIVGTGANYHASVTRTQYSLATNSGAQIRFRITPTSTNFVLALENNDTTYRRLAIFGDGTGKLRMQYNDGGGWRYPVALTPTLQANTWYTLTLLVDDLRGNTIEVYSNPNGPRYTYNIGLATGKTWRFHAWVWSGTLDLDDYREFTTGSGAVVTPDERMQFTYDHLDRLLSATKTTTDGYSQSYGYDAIGNIISTTMLGTYIYNPSGPNSIRPHAVIAAGNNLYDYDANGNMTRRVEVTATQRITYTQRWDTENRLIQVDNTYYGPCFPPECRLGAITEYHTPTAKFTYDGDGARVLQLLPDGSKTAYAGALEVTITGTQRITKTYYSAGSQLIAMRQFTTPTTSVLYFLHSDHLGSTSLTTDASGNPVARQLYDAWGNVRASAASGTMPTDIGYTGQRLDNSTGLMYYRARYYASSLGRFASADTIVPDGKNPQSLNRFSYVGNNPLRYVDPTGHMRTCEDSLSEGCGTSKPKSVAVPPWYFYPSSLINADGTGIDPNNVVVTFSRPTPSYMLDRGRFYVGCLSSAATCTTVSRFVLRGDHNIGGSRVIAKHLKLGTLEKLANSAGWAYIDYFLLGIPVSVLGSTFVPDDTDYATDTVDEYLMQLHSDTKSSGKNSVAPSMEVFFVDKLYQPIRRIPYDYEGQYGWIDSGYSLIMIRPEGSRSGFRPVVVSFDLSVEIQAELQLNMWASDLIQ